MASFAKLNNSNIVISVESINNEVIKDENGVEQEYLGINFLRKLYNEPNANWKQSSYNTRHGKYWTDCKIDQNQTKSFRLNHAGINYTWDENLQGFLPPKPYSSWVLYTGEITSKKLSYEWYAPIEAPNKTPIGSLELPDSIKYRIDWDEENQRWISYSTENTNIKFVWNINTFNWEQI